MKKKLLASVILLGITINSSFAQHWSGNSNITDPIYRDGSVGIGSSTPAAKLDVNFFNANGAIPQYGLLLRTNSFHNGPNAESSYYLKATDDGNGAVAFIVKGNSLVGIGTGSPAHTLDVRGNIYTDGNMIIDGGDLILKRTTASYGHIVRPNVDGYRNLAFTVEGGGQLENVAVNANLSVFNGNVGIGTNNLGTNKLAVEGNIAARGVKVTLLNPFPDYVFESTYQLRPLASLSKYINQNKHLPGIPSAAEVKKDGGIELGDMNVRLLEKVEELTLYILELNKKLEAQQKKIDRLEKSASN